MLSHFFLRKFIFHCGIRFDRTLYIGHSANLYAERIHYVPVSIVRRRLNLLAMLIHLAKLLIQNADELIGFGPSLLACLG